MCFYPWSNPGEQSTQKHALSYYVYMSNLYNFKVSFVVKCALLIGWLGFCTRLHHTSRKLNDIHCKLNCQCKLSMTEISESQMGVVPITFWTLVRCSSKIHNRKNPRQTSHQSIAEVDDEVNDVTSEPGTPNDNKPITASRAKGHTLNNKTDNPQFNDYF